MGGGQSHFCQRPPVCSSHVQCGVPLCELVVLVCARARLQWRGLELVAGTAQGVLARSSKGSQHAERVRMDAGLARVSRLSLYASIFAYVNF